MAGPKTKKGSDGLSDLDRRFCLEYLVDLNALDAYIRASLPRKVTRKTAGTNGWKLLQRPEIQKRVRAARDEALAKADLSVQDTMLKLKQFLMYDVRDLAPKGEDGEMNGRLIPLQDLPDDLAAACVGVKEGQWGREYKFADKVAALEKAMKYHGLFERDNKQQTEALKEITIKLVKAVGGS